MFQRFVVLSIQDGGNGREFLQMVIAMTKELGYREIINSFYNTNVRVKTSSNKMAADVMGVIPRVGFINGYGWADETVAIIDLTSSSVPTFSQMVQQNQT